MVLEWVDRGVDGWVVGYFYVCPKVDSVTIHRLRGPPRSFPIEASNIPSPGSGY